MAGTPPAPSRRTGGMNMATTQPPSPPKGGDSYTDSSDSLLVICDTPGDTTIRPARPNLDPPGWPPRNTPPPPPKPPEDQPPAPEKPSEGADFQTSIHNACTVRFPTPTRPCKRKATCHST